MELRSISDETGSQGVERLARLLRALAASPYGARLSDLARATGLAKGTTHRLLGALAAERLAEQDAQGQFHLGLDVVALGAAASRRGGLAERALPAMRRLAETTGDTVYLSLRAGNDHVCLARVEGAFPIRTLTLAPGDRRPLGIGAGGLALLAFLPPAECAAIIAANATRLPAFNGLDAAALTSMVEAARAEHHALNNDRIIPGMTAVGLPLLGAHGRPVAALSVAAISPRMGGERRARVLAWLRAETAALQAMLAPVLDGPAAEQFLAPPPLRPS